MFCEQEIQKKLWGDYYISKLVEKDYEKLKNIFNEKSKAGIFYKVRDLILNNERFLERINGDIIGLKQENENTFLGWEEWKLYFEEENPTCYKVIISEGKRIVNEYRKARGLEEID